jgi:uncharacterized protein YqgQ
MMGSFEKGIFTKEEFLGMVKVVDQKRKREKRKENNRRRLFL